MARLHDSVELCFMLGLRHGEIRQLLGSVDEISIIMRTLRRISKRMDFC